ncbi:MAG: S8 family serine peptidase, partial [Chloroflexi bacterium]|nr:S8 family serine peptidase [Chloroflexota bacterium]
MSNIPIRLIAILPMPLLVAALIATACESAPPDDASQGNAIAAAAPTTTPTPTPTATATPPPEHTQTPTPTAALPQCRPGVYDADSPEAQACRGRPNPVGCPQGRIPPAPWIWDIEDGKVAVAGCLLPPGPPPVYPKLAGSLSKVAELYESGASAQSAARAASVDDELREGRLHVYIDTNRDPRELVIWLNDNGAEFGSVNGTYLVDEGWPVRNETTIEAEYGIILLSEYLRGEAEPEEPYEGGLAYVGASVPVSLLVRLSERPGVLKVEVPLRLSAPQQTDAPPAPQEPQDPVTPTRTSTPTPRATSQALSTHGVTSWHQAGFKGRGVKIGIIDVGFEGFSSNNNGSDLPARVSARCYRGSSNPTSRLRDCETRNDPQTPNNHGTLVAEVIYDIAPEAAYYVAQVNNERQLNSAVDWMVSQNVDVINYSVALPWDGPGDGTSPVSDSPINTVATAVSGNALWVNAAGNYAKRTWYGRFIPTSPDEGNYHRFRNNNTCNRINWGTTGEKYIQLRWEDAGTPTPTGSELGVIVHNGSRTPIPNSTPALYGGSQFYTFNVAASGNHCVYVLKNSGSNPRWIQLNHHLNDGDLRYYASSGSIVNPAESINSGMLAVGAASWSNNGLSIYGYSSQGPLPAATTVVKPDMAAASRVSVSTMSGSFTGTSAAAPHVAGMAALILQRYSSYTPAQVANYLRNNAEPRGTATPNNTWGYGFAKLPALSTPTP